MIILESVLLELEVGEGLALEDVLTTGTLTSVIETIVTILLVLTVHSLTYTSSRSIP